MTAAASVRVLLVEDNDDHAALIEGELEDAAGFDVARATSLAGAADMLGRATFDSVLLDLGLPESRGLETLTRMLQVARAVPLVVLTSDSERALGIEALRTGAQDFLPKLEVGAAALSRAIHFSIHRKRSERELSRRNRLLETFAASAGHDLMAPARHVAFLARFMIGERGQDLDEGDRTTLGEIVERAEHLEQLLTAAMDFARLGARNAAHSEIRLDDLIRQIRTELPEAERGRVSCSTDTGLRVDRALAYIVLRNIVTNGLKYWRGTPSTVQVRGERRGGESWITVTDTGMGIPAAMHERIFQAGVRATSDGEFPGTGFGLAICQDLVAAHDGRIWVTSEPGVGSCFHIVLPS